MDSFGKTAFNAYRYAKQGTTYDAKPIPAWEDLSDDVRSAWEVAAEAAIIQAGMTQDVWSALKHAYYRCKNAKPNDRSEADRRFAILITKMEDALAHYHLWITGGVSL